MIPHFLNGVDSRTKFDIGVTAIVKVTLRDGTFHEDVGWGSMENAKTKAAGLEKVCPILLMAQILTVYVVQERGCY